MRRRLIALLGVLLSIGAVALSIHLVDVNRSLEALQRAELWPWVPLAILSYLVGQVVRGWRCRQMVSIDADLPLTTATNVVVVGYAVNNLLPARLGEFARAGLLAERAGLPFSQSLSVTVVERVIDGIVILFYFAVGASWLHLGGWVELAKTNGVAVFGIATVGLAVVVLWPRRILWMVAQLAPARFRDRLLTFTADAVRGAAYLRGTAQALEIVVLTLIVWAFEAGMFLAVMAAFGLPLNPLWAVVAMAITNLGILFPSSPGFIGTFHFFAMQALVSMGVDDAIALGYAFVVHLTFYIPITLWGISALSFYGVRLAESVAVARSARRTDGVPDEITGIQVVGEYAVDTRRPTVSSFLSSTVEALLPAEAASHEACRGDVEQFVAEQMAALPRSLRVLLAVGLSAFRGFVRLRTLRAFSALPLARRRQLAESWAYGSFALARQLFRPLRSTVLLAYYEHPEVAAARQSSPGHS